MKKEDIDFLKDLQNELLTQDNHCTANPLTWGIIEEHLQIVPDGYGDISYVVDDGLRYTEDEFIKFVEACISEIDDEEEREHFLEEWEDVDKMWISDVIDFYNDFLGGDADMFEYVREERLSMEGNSFLTERACKNHIEKYGYNFNKPRPYCMCAYRNSEYERLLNILKKLDFNDIKED